MTEFNSSPKYFLVELQLTDEQDCIQELLSLSDKEIIKIKKLAIAFDQTFAATVHELITDGLFKYRD